MKLFAQVGFGVGEKVHDGLSDGSVTGAIFSPKDLQKSTLEEKINSIRQSYPEAELLIDPQFYLSLYSEAKLGKTDDWTSFKTYRKGDLELTDKIDGILEDYFKETSQFDVNGYIAPSIYVSQSFDSREAVIAKNFIRRTGKIFKNSNNNKPVYASLIISRETLLDQREFEEFLNDITMLSDPPDGFYIIVASRTSGSKSDIYHADVIANWMMLNLSLSINGFSVINGYSDILSPFLGAAGAYAGATGWWSNLQMFSMERFFPKKGGGRLPIVRYLSKQFLNRVTFSEKDIIANFVPDVINGLSHDAHYSEGEPERKYETLQSWEALNALISEADGSLQNCIDAVIKAQNFYAAWSQTGLPLDPKSDGRHLDALSEGIRLYKKRAQLD
jgi:hypothetical protein